MNGIQLNGSRARNYEKPVPGCLGRMVDLFDLTSGVARSRLLTDKPHRDGSPLSRSRSDVSRLWSPIGKEIEDKMPVSEVKPSSSNKKSQGTPVKMLIAQEMSNDLELKQSSPNVVAKLMGLDALPQQPTNLSRGRSHSKCHLRNSYSEIPAGYWHQEGEYLGDEIHCDNHQCPEQCKFKDIYEIWEPIQRTNCLRDVSPCKGRCNNDVSSERKMARIRKKYMEAKRLSTDEKLCQTKEFHDALEVLSSNQDLFLKVLQETNSLISHHLYGEQPIPPPVTKRITVLRPSKIVYSDKFPASGNGRDKNVKKQVQVDQANVCENENHRVTPATPTWKIDDSIPTQPTQIVVLKPSPRKIQDVKAVISSTPSPPRNLQKRIPEDDQVQEAREVAKGIIQKMRENLAGHRRDETLLSSVFSNGYTGDESSFNKSEAEFVVGNLSDSEIMSPPSRHSWDYISQFGSPCSCSSLSRVSFSLESSVCREAKKRLSERWAMMASNGAREEQKNIRRSLSTLGEMLALFDVKESERNEGDYCKKDQHPRASTSCLASNTGECKVESPSSLLRSKSLPVSANAFSERLNVESSGKGVGKTNSLKEASKSTTKSSFRGKVTSLFFSRSKKSRKEMSHNYQSKDEVQSNCSGILPSPMTLGRPCNNISKYHGCEEILPPHLQSARRSVLRESNLGETSVSRRATVRNLVENQEQPSPISVLEPPFKEEGNATPFCSVTTYRNQLGKQMPFCLGKSNLIDKSPPIGSISRTLSWDQPCTESATSHPLKSSFLSPGGGAEDEGEWLFLVQSLLSLADLEDESQLISNLARWHSPNSPLHPLLQEKFMDLNKEPLAEAKGRYLRSNRKIVFDCVNAVLVDIMGLSTNLACSAEFCVGSTEIRPMLADRVWARVMEWFLLSRGDGGEMRGFYGEDSGGDRNSLAMERVVRKELMGRGWADQIRSEIGDIGKEIEGKLLEELVEDSVCELTR